MLKFIACCVVAFLAGIIVGIGIDVKERGNLVRMAVQYDSHEVYVAPFVGDTVQWFKVQQDGSFKQIQANFGPDPSMSPCNPAYNDQSNCHIRKPDNLRDRYRYQCSDPCIDPGGGPQSTTNLIYMGPTGPQFWPVVEYDFKGVFGMQQQSSPAAGHAEPEGMAPATIVGNPIHMSVACPSDTKKLTVYDSNYNPTTSINAVPNNQIVWDTTLNLTITDNNSNLCSGDISDLAHSGCIINTNATGNHTYIASSTDSKCSAGNSSTQNVVLP